MSDSIDPRNAGPDEYLRWLQLQEANHPSAFGSWSSLAASDALRDRGMLENRLKETTDLLKSNLVYLESIEREGWERALSESMAELLSAQRPNNAGNLAYHSTLAKLVGHVEQAAARLGYDVPNSVTFGTLPTGRVNGLACAVPAGGLIVAIDDGVFNFLYSLAKAIATFCKVTVANNAIDFSWIDKDIAQAVRTNEDANRRYLEILVATFVFGYPNKAPFRPLMDDRSHLIDLLTTGGELFIVGHEFGHLILGHYAHDHGVSRRRLSSGTEFDELNTEMQEELEADSLGLELLREYHRSVGLSADNTRWAVWFWAGCLRIVEEMSMSGTSTTHPPAAMRAEKTLEQLAREDGITMEASSFGHGIYRVMDELWRHNHSRFLEWENRALSGDVPWEQS